MKETIFFLTKMKTDFKKSTKKVTTAHQLLQNIASPDAGTFCRCGVLLVLHHMHCDLQPY